jgi:hypothetical protein
VMQKPHDRVAHRMNALDIGHDQKG